jgi:hypothetical protein
MSFTKYAVGLTAFTLGIASAASSYSVKLTSPMSIGSTQLKAGEYKVEVQGDKAVFKMGKSSTEVPATLAKGDQKKYPVTSLVSNGTNLVEIDLGGTTDKIVFSPSGSQSAGGSR